VYKTGGGKIRKTVFYTFDVPASESIRAVGQSSRPFRTRARAIYLTVSSCVLSCRPTIVVETPPCRTLRASAYRGGLSDGADIYDRININGPHEYRRTNRISRRKTYATKRRTIVMTYLFILIFYRPRTARVYVLLCTTYPRLYVRYYTQIRGVLTLVT